jgi:hypothetical protein
VARLACYDAAFKPSGPAAAPRAESSGGSAPSAGSGGSGPQPGPAPSSGSGAGPAVADIPAPQRSPGTPNLTIPDGQRGWLRRAGTSALDKSPIEVALLPASTVSMSRSVPGMKQHAAMVVRCQEGKTDVYVAFSDIVDGMSPPIRVSSRIGSGGTPRTGNWQISQDRQSYGFWHTPQTIPLLKELMAADEFFVRSDAGAMGTAEASFKLAGMDQAIAGVRETCKW